MNSSVKINSISLYFDHINNVSNIVAIKGEINSIGKMPVEIHDGPVFYGPDGQIMTEEENTFLLSNIKTYDKPYDDFGE